MTGNREEKLAEVAKLKEQDEKAYSQMYELHDDKEIRWQYELAYDSLRSAARIAREVGLAEEAAEAEKRAEHVREVYRHQFMQSPDRWTRNLT